MITYSVFLWIISLSITSSRSTHAVANGIISFLWLSNIPFYIYKPHFFIHLYTDGHLDCFHILTAVNNASRNIKMHISFLLVFSFLFSNIFPGVELPDYMAVLFLVFWGTSILFSSGCSNLHSHQQHARAPFSPHLPQHLFVDFLMIDILTGVEWYLIVASICISLKINNAEIFPRAYCSSMHLLWKNVYLDDLPIFSSGCFLILSYTSCLYILYINPLLSHIIFKCFQTFSWFSLVCKSF